MIPIGNQRGHFRVLFSCRLYGLFVGKVEAMGGLIAIEEGGYRDAASPCVLMKSNAK